MARRKRQALSRIANLSGGGPAKRRRISPEGIASGKENHPVRNKTIRTRQGALLMNGNMV